MSTFDTRRAACAPSAEASQISLGSALLASSRDVTAYATHRPSGEMRGAPTERTR